MNYKVKNQKTEFSNFLTVKSADVEYDTFTGGKIEMNMKVLERGDSVAVLVKETDTNSFLFTNQFRFPVTFKDKGWLLEIPAGGLKQNEDIEVCARREIEEELGYKVNSSMKFISKFYVSPGGTSERIFLYYCEVISADRISDGGGLIEEKEDIELVKLSIEDSFKLIGDKIIDGKSILAIQWYFLNK